MGTTNKGSTNLGAKWLQEATKIVEAGVLLPVFCFGAAKASFWLPFPHLHRLATAAGRLAVGRVHNAARRPQVLCGCNVPGLLGCCDVVIAGAYGLPLCRVAGVELPSLQSAQPRTNDWRLLLLPQQPWALQRAKHHVRQG